MKLGRDDVHAMQRINSEAKTEGLGSLIMADGYTQVNAELVAIRYRFGKQVLRGVGSENSPNLMAGPQARGD